MLCTCGRGLLPRLGVVLGQRSIAIISTGIRGLSGAADSERTGSVGGNKGTNSKNPRQSTMRSWELHSYGGPSELQLTESAKVPFLKDPHDIIVRVIASSVNPIDVAMTRGYGATAINALRNLDEGGLSKCPSRNHSSIIEFPLTLGRDFAGVVEEMGHGVTEFNLGDEVYGVLGVQKTGSHAELVVTSSSTVKKKPRNQNFIEAASFPYVGLTTWSAIHITGAYQNLNHKKFLILGGSGGVGNFMIQYLTTRGAYVVSTCSGDAIELLSKLGTDFIVDYNDPDYESYIKNHSPYDCIIDLTGQSRQPVLCRYLKPVAGQYVTLSPPFLSNMDKYGLVGGLARNLNDIVWENWKSLGSERIPTKWAFFIPSGAALATFTPLIEAGKIKPIIQETFKFENLPEAYEKLAAGHARGKIVIDFS